MPTVKRTLADGTVKTYRYPKRAKKHRSHGKAGTLGALILQYRRTPEYQGLKPATRKVYERAMGYMEELYGVAVVDLKRRHAKALRDAHADRPALADQVKRMFSILMQFAVDQEYRESNPALRIGKLSKGEYARWTDEQIVFALKHLAEPYRRALLLGLYTGQRAGDVARMPWSDYDGEGIQVAQEKTGAKLWVPCHRALRRELETWKADRASVTILTAARGKPWAHGGSFSTAFSAAVRRHPELDGCVFHGLRKTAAAKLAEAGASTLEIAAITGHTTLSMIELYTRQAEQKTRARAAVVKLESVRRTKRPSGGNK